MVSSWKRYYFLRVLTFRFKIRKLLLRLLRSPIHQRPRLFTASLHHILSHSHYSLLPLHGHLSFIYLLHLYTFHIYCLTVHDISRRLYSTTHSLYELLKRPDSATSIEILAVLHQRARRVVPPRTLTRISSYSKTGSVCKTAMEAYQGEWNPEG